MPSAVTPSLNALLAHGRVTQRAGFTLDDHDPRGPVPDGLDKAGAEHLLAEGVMRLSSLQERLYAQSTWSLLVIIQAMDAAGKDGTIKHVLSGINPQGVAVTAFKAPGPEDLAHDFLWRPTRMLPARGMIGIFNRSYYEDVLVPRIHPEALARQRLPAGLTDGAAFWEGRLDDIAGFERHLGREGTRVVKVFLNVSRDEQKRRLVARLEEPEKFWKFDPLDLSERRLWGEYRAAYEAAIAATATPAAPWHVIPADRKWLMRLLVHQVIVGALADLDLAPARPSPAALAQMVDARRALEAER